MHSLIDTAESITDLYDNLAYHYLTASVGGQNKLLSNRLYHVNDAIINMAQEEDDIEDQGLFTSSEATINSVNNYSYDEIGNLIKDTKEQIESITWTVSGKIEKINRISNSSYPDLEFKYDAQGNRISKIVKPSGSLIDPTQWSKQNISTTHREIYYRFTKVNLFPCE